jgi:hypothetical protein
MVRLLIGLVFGFYTSLWAQTPSEVQVQQVQQELSTLGYDPGAIDGVWGQRTREAIVTFQQDQELPVTGQLDALTLQALGLTPTPDTAQAPPVPEPPVTATPSVATPAPVVSTPTVEAPTEATSAEPGTPEDSTTASEPAPEEDLAPTNVLTPGRLVMDYLRFYESQPGRVLPYVTEHFRGDMLPEAWIAYTLTTVAERNYSRLAWEIQRVEVEDDSQATVQVRSHIRVDDQESTQKEIFTLIRGTAEDSWRIDTWESTEITNTKTATSRTDPPAAIADSR